MRAGRRIASLLLLALIVLPPRATAQAPPTRAGVLPADTWPARRRAPSKATSRGMYGRWRSAWCQRRGWGHFVFLNRLLLPIFLAVSVSGCAAMKNTPAQERAQAAWDACHAEGRIPQGFQVIRIEPAGRLWFRGSSDGTLGYGEVHACLNEKRRIGRQ